MAYKTPIPEHRCYCGRPARFEVFNTGNATCGFFCRQHADVKLAQLREHEGRPVFVDPWPPEGVGE